MERLDHWWDAEAKLEEVSEQVLLLQARLDALIARHASHCEENAVLREYLEASGLIRTEVLLARQHRHHFNRMCARHPCAWAGSLELTAGTREGIYVLAEFAGRHCMSTLATTSPAFRRSVANASSELAATLPPMVYVIGGEDDDGQALADVERLCPDTGVWEPSVSLRVARKCCAAAAFAGHIYVIGGWAADFDTLSSVDRFDPWLNSWEGMPRMFCRRGAAAAVCDSAAVWAIGGQDGDLVHASVEALDSVTGGWSVLPSLQHPRHAGDAVNIVGQMFVIGGIDAGNATLGSVERYDPQVGTWVWAPPLRIPRAGLAAAAIRERAYVVGGCDCSGHELSSLERLDPHTGAWEMLASLAVPRWGLGAVGCAGRIYALGGSGCAEDASIGACERYFPVECVLSHSPRGEAGHWSFIGCLHVPRRLFGAAASR